jgi:hypothetical protein
MGVVELQLHAYLTSVRHGGEWSASLPGRSTFGKKSVRCGEQKNLLHLPGVGHESSAIQTVPVTILTTLLRLYLNRLINNYQ